MGDLEKAFIDAALARADSIVNPKCEDCGRALSLPTPTVMRWDAAGTNWLVSDRFGIWESALGTFTWCEDQGFGPTHWRPAPAEATGEGGGDAG